VNAFPNFKLRAVLGAAVAATVLGLPSIASAATASATLTVTANVAANCKISTTNVAFGAYDPLGAGNLQSNGTVVITCVKNTAPTSIDLDPGLHFLGTRRMQGAAATPDLIAYELYKPTSNAAGAACAYTTVWTTGAVSGLVPVAAPSNAPRTYNVCGQAALGQNVQVDTYSDTVNATVNF